MGRHVFRRPHDYRTPRRRRAVCDGYCWLGIPEKVINQSSAIYNFGDPLYPYRCPVLAGDTFLIYWISIASPVVPVYDAQPGADQSTSSPGVFLSLYTASASGAFGLTSEPKTGLGSPLTTSWVWGAMRVGRNNRLDGPAVGHAYWDYGEPNIYTGRGGKVDLQVGNAFDCCNSSDFVYPARSLLIAAGSAPGGNNLTFTGSGDFPYGGWNRNVFRFHVGFDDLGVGNDAFLSWRWSEYGQAYDNSVYGTLGNPQFLSDNTVEGAGAFVSVFEYIAAGQMHIAATGGNFSYNGGQPLPSPTKIIAIGS